MQVLRILSFIWKSGANISLDKSDDRIAIERPKLIPKEVMDAAEQNSEKIDEWFKSWKNASAEKITLMKMVHQICGWQHNEKLNDWLCNEDGTFALFDEWMCSLARNGWNDIYEDFRQFENDESNKMARELYMRAVNYAKKQNKAGERN
ncbi:hypothetical protein [Peribacillus aracenensis]|uniref:hypothetical protein n=1 Tax=Peribacillus aracenensis TaxID=2976708 RepID=UPI0021A4491B|nr:hypothetical protein [Peribacillus sp. BBB004]